MSVNYFYRVKSDQSFTIYQGDGFFSPGDYEGDYEGDWLDRTQIMRHLDWNNRSEPWTPFISVFDNPGMSSPLLTRRPSS